jgi:aldose 1-epimerase
LGTCYHTTFLFPEDTCRFSLTTNRRWKLNELLLPTGELEGLEYPNQLTRGVNPKGWGLDDVFLSSVLTGGRNNVMITDMKNNLSVIYEADEHFLHWVVYNADGLQGFVCPEPYTWVTNAPNFQVPASLSGFQSLLAGKETTVKSQINVSIIDR